MFVGQVGVEEFNADVFDSNNNQGLLQLWRVHRLSCVWRRALALALTRLSLTFASRLVDARTTIFLDQYALDVDDDQVLSLPV